MTKYYAIPKATNDTWLGANTYASIVKQAKNSLKNNPSIGSYQIVEYVALVSCDVSVSVECFLTDEKDVSFDSFAPLPHNIPAPPEGFVYYGKNPIYESNTVDINQDIAIYEFFDKQWSIGSYGDSWGNHYAVRAETPAYRDAVEEFKARKKMSYNE